MLRKLLNIKNSGIFHDFTWDKDIPEFQRITLIYGNNGAGKTSLARAIERTSQDEGYADVSIEMSNSDGSSVRASNFQPDDEFKRVFVFSEDYITRSLSFDENAKIQAILTLGPTTVEIDKRIDALDQQIKDVEALLPEQEAELARTENNLEDTYRSIGQEVVGLLSRAGGKYRSNNSYNRGVVAKKYLGDHSGWKLLDDRELEAALSTINSGTRFLIDKKHFGFSVRPDFFPEVEAILATQPITKILDTLTVHQQASHWVDAGRALHRDLDQCLFCAGPLTQKRKDELSAHFSNEVASVQDSVERLQDEAVGYQEALKSLLGDESITLLLFDHLRPAFSDARRNALSEIDSASSSFEYLASLLESKRADPLLQIPVREVAAELKVDGQPLERVVREHNSIVDKHIETVAQSAQSVENHVLKKHESKVKQIVKAHAEAEGAVASTSYTLKQYRAQRQGLASVSADPSPSARTLKIELARILGRSELEFELLPDDGHYAVTRNGKPARELSTGERTALSLIHFLELVKCSPKGVGRPIVVIDDPISSLDSGSSFGISTYIWSHAVSAGSIEQVIMLTHDFELFRQWDIQIDGLEGGRGSKNKRGFTSCCLEIKSKYAQEGSTYVRRPSFVAWPPNEHARKKVRSNYHHAFWTVGRALLSLREE